MNFNLNQLSVKESISFLSTVPVPGSLVYSVYPLSTNYDIVLQQ